jgi:hypothetical protein
MPHGLFQSSLTTHGVWALAAVAALVGMTFWLGGARFNRSVATLAGVLVGGVVGMELPRLMGWTISGMGPAIGGAMALGVVGFMLHRAWVGMGLGLLLAALAGIVAWHMWGPGAQWTWPAGGAGRKQWLMDVWTHLPLEMRYRLPIITGTALFTGVALGLLWTRGAMVLMYSLAGVSLLAGLLLAATGGVIHHPQWLAGHAGTQGALFVLMVAGGAALQWRGARRAVPVSNSAKEQWDEDD